MNIHELDTYRLSDAVKFHDQLNPRLWDESEQLRPEVREALLKIAADFQEFLGVPDLDLEDITVSGSNAAYSYTPHSDIDLHLVVRMPEHCDEVYRELFNAKKYQYNDLHDIQIRGADVELYVQPSDEPVVSLGEYSVLRDQWIQVPRRRRAKIDHSLVRHKYEDLRTRIENALGDDDADRIQNLVNKIKKMRQSGLAQHGEFGPENLVFKMLRTQGWIKRLYDRLAAARDQELSLAEKKKQSVRYGFRTMEDDGAQSTWDGVSPDTQEFLDEEGSSPSGVSPGTHMFVSETPDDQVLRQFINHTAQRLGIERMPRIHLHRDPTWSETNHSFGRYDPESHELHVSLPGRHLLDILRTTAHELAHCRQHEVEPLPDHAGATGSDWENEAHAVAGVVMRDFADAHPEYFEQGELAEGLADIPRVTRNAILAACVAVGAQGCATVGQGLSTTRDVVRVAQSLERMGRAGAQEELAQELKNYARARGGDANAQNQSILYRRERELREASGYIPTEAEKDDPRFVMALTQDVRPGEVGRQANRMSLDTDSQGRPALLMKTANLREGRMPQPSQGPGHYRDLNEPLGPETPPTMPVGTVRVDVSDVYDWYKLGQHISNLKGLGHHDFGKGPPSTIVSFGDEETEHKYIQDLEKTGLTTTDIDPKDPDQPPGMKPQKTDPTYNVDEDEILESLRQEFAVMEDEILGEITMSPSSLAKAAAEIPGALAGMEFEMIIPGVVLGDRDSGEDLEPDYNQDERVAGLRDIVDFFDSEFNTRRSVQRAVDALWDDYMDSDWLSERKQEQWVNSEASVIEDWVRRNERDELEQQAIEGVQDQDESRLWTPGNPEFQRQVEVRYEELVEERTEDIRANQGREYDAAFDRWEEDDWQSEWNTDGMFVEWLNSEGIRYMSDVASETDLTWPIWTPVENAGDNIQAVATQFERAIGRPVKWSSRYHGADRDPRSYVVEPDSSLDPNDSDDSGLEFVSPPLPVEEMFRDLDRVYAWANDVNAYTNSSTGLHINVSVPALDTQNLDYVKLVLLLGDQHVLGQFGRLANRYAKSAMEKILARVSQRPEETGQMMGLMKQGLAKQASEMIHKPFTDKYTSVNVKGGYIEFRSPGGDWLNEDPQKIKNTLLRFVVALDAAADPEKYREEYLKKLYAILAPKSNNDPVALFARYSAGDLPQSALKSFIRQIQLQRQGKKQPAASSTDHTVNTNIASNEPQWRVRRHDNNEEMQVGAVSGVQAIRRAVEQNQSWKYDYLSGNLSLSDLSTQPQQTPAQPEQSQWTGRWEVRDVYSRRVLYTFGGVGNDRTAAARIGSQWARERGIEQPIDVVPEMTR